MQRKDMSDLLYPSAIEDLLVDLHHVKRQIRNDGGNAWTVPAVSRAMVIVTLLEDRIHELENERKLLKSEIEELKNGEPDD